MTKRYIYICTKCGDNGTDESFVIHVFCPSIEQDVLCLCDDCYRKKMGKGYDAVYKTCLKTKDFLISQRKGES